MYENICCHCRYDTKGDDPCPICGEDLHFCNNVKELQPRTILDNKYIVCKRLGKRGGFGITYLGIEPELDIWVAIKEYFPSEIADRDNDKSTVRPNTTDKECKENYENGLKLFLKEARTLSKLRHHNLINVLSFFKENNTAYFIMPYIPGKTLEEYIQESNGLSQKNLMDIMVPILDGLQVVHEKGFLHLDIKPANIYIPDKDPPLLLDFGSARQAMLSCSQPFSFMLLTPGFAPLEQYTKSLKQGPYTDIYAVAATMYSSLRGQFKSNGSIEPPVSATDRHDGTTLAHIRDIAIQGISDDLANAIMKGLELHWSDRPQTINELKQMINAPITTIDDTIKDFEILVLKGEFKGERIPISSQPITIGRSSRNSVLILSNKTISSIHCQIYTVNGIVYVKDMNSSNGTWVNGEKKLNPFETAKLGIGDTFSLVGCSVFQVIVAENIPRQWKRYFGTGLLILNILLSLLIIISMIY